MNNLNKLLVKEIAYPDSIFLSDTNKSLTQKEFQLEVKRKHQKLRGKGITKNDHVAVWLKNSADYVSIIAALWQIGAVVVPINKRSLEKEILELANFADCKFMILDEQVEKLNHDKLNIIYLNDLNTIEATTNIFEIYERSVSDIALLMFTSGSTGKPKAVQLSFNNLLSSAENGNQFFKSQSGDKWLASLPFYHIGGFSIIVRSIILDGALILPDELNHESIIKSLVKDNPHYLSLVTTQLKRMIEDDIAPNSNHKKLLLGGGFLERSLVDKAIEKGWNVAKSYGATESASFVTYLSKDIFNLKPESAGTALPNNEIYIVDENGNELEENVSGEIILNGPSISIGYYKNDVETNLKFKNGFYFTGDHGYLDDDNYLFVEARKNDLIITGGENVNPLEVEQEIKSFSKVKDASVFGFKDNEWGYAIAAAIVPRSKKFDLEELKIFLNLKLPGFKHPKKIFFVEELPKTELGKVQKQKLREMFE